MAIAKDVIERKQRTTKILQDKRYLKETRLLSSHVKKRGQTPMQRKVAAQNAFSHSVPAQDEATNNDNANIEYLMQMVMNNSKAKSDVRKTELGFITLDMGIIRMNQESLNAPDPCPSPESSHNSSFPPNSNSNSNSQCGVVEGTEQDPSKVLDLFNMKKGLIRCSYLNLLNTEGLPEFIYISKQGPNSMAQRVSTGSTQVTAWDKFLITFVKIIDAHVASVINKTDNMPLKTLMFELLHLQSVCSKEQRFQRLSIEFSIPAIGERMDEYHILGEIYRKRETVIKRVMKDTADILQKDIDVKKGKLLFDTPSVGSDAHKFPVIDDSRTLATFDSSFEGSGSSSCRKAVKSRKKWVKKLCATTQQHNSGMSVASITSSNSAHSQYADRQVVGSNTRARSVRASGDHQSENNSVFSEYSCDMMDINAIVDGSVTMSCNQSRSVHSLPRSQSATTRNRRDISTSPLPLMPTPGRGEPSFLTDITDSIEESCPLQTTQLISTTQRPHTASFVPHQTMSFYKENTANCDDAIYYHNDSPYIPWVPKGGMKMMISDKTDVLNGWRERREIGNYVETTRSTSVLKRTGLVRNSFEAFTKSNPNFATRSLDLSLSHQH
jgi:hypothetical protein